MNVKKQIVLYSVLVVFFMVVSVGLCFYIAQTQNFKRESYKKSQEVKTFSDWTEESLFQNVPALISDETRIGTVVDTGAGTRTIDINGTSLEHYQDYIKLLQEQGFELLVDNGEEGLDGVVYTSNLKRDELSLAVTHLVKTDKTYVIAGENQNISQYLTYDEESTKNISAEAKTKLHMPELYNFGNSFIFELKNGHFVLNDGGTEDDLIYLIEYLESLVPEGEKPIIDAWIISHAHEDHMGVYTELLNHLEWADRFYVEEVIYSEPNREVFLEYNVNTAPYVNSAISAMRTTDGKKPNVVRPVMGQRYYFCDIVVEVVLSQDFLLLKNYQQNFNDSSTWLMYHIDGQKALLGGDGDYAGMKTIMNNFNSEYFTLDFFQNLHHSYNVYDYWTDFCPKMTTVFVPIYDPVGYWVPTVAGGTRLMSEEFVNANKKIIEKAEEAYTGEGGTLVMTFPYVVGTAERLEPSGWEHHNGVKEDSDIVKNWKKYQESLKEE